MTGKIVFKINWRNYKNTIKMLKKKKEAQEKQREMCAVYVAPQVILILNMHFLALPE